MDTRHQVKRRHSNDNAAGSPAHAGIDLRPRRSLRRGARFPRTRGDRPVTGCDCVGGLAGYRRSVNLNGVAGNDDL